MPRIPYPFPRFENDKDFSHDDGKQNQVAFQHIKSDDKDTWHRLYEAKTQASERREVFHDDPLTPHDSLDFVIKSAYNHHQEFLKSTAETLFQPETLAVPHSRFSENQKDRANCKQDKKTCVGNPPFISVSEKRENIHSINGAIPSHHSAATNRGYSRKNDGGFYSC